MTLSEQPSHPISQLDLMYSFNGYGSFRCRQLHLVTVRDYVQPDLRILSTARSCFRPRPKDQTPSRRSSRRPQRAMKISQHKSIKPCPPVVTSIITADTDRPYLSASSAHPTYARPIRERLPSREIWLRTRATGQTKGVRRRTR